MAGDDALNSPYNTLQIPFGLMVFIPNLTAGRRCLIKTMCKAKSGNYEDEGAFKTFATLADKPISEEDVRRRETMCVQGNKRGGSGV